MFFLITVFELILFVSGLSMLHHYRVGTGGTLILLAIILFFLTSFRYLARQRAPLSCCGTECSFLEGLACAECLDTGVGGMDCMDCGVMDCGN